MSRPRLWLVLALILGLALVGYLTLPKPSQAQEMRCGHEFDYYDDATYTNQIGMRYWDCPPYCTFSSWGTTSSYVIIWDLGCS